MSQSPRGRGRGARGLGGDQTNLSSPRGRGRGARDLGGCRTNLSSSRGRGRGARGFNGSEGAGSYSSSRGDTGGSWNWNDGGFGGGGAGSRSHLSNSGASSDPGTVLCNSLNMIRCTFDEGRAYILYRYNNILVIENKIYILKYVDLYIHKAHLLLYNYSLLSLDNVPMCNCGEVALLLTVRREDSVNKGKNSM